jgi:hypothetical protein
MVKRGESELYNIIFFCIGRGRKFPIVEYNVRILKKEITCNNMCDKNVVMMNIV